MKQGKTLSELAAELERQEAAKQDYIADTSRMHFTTAITTPVPGTTTAPTRSEIDLLGDGSTEETNGLVVLDYAHRQIADHLKIPSRFYERLRTELPSLLDENVNRLFRHGPKRRMIRTLDGQARAFLSDRYRRLDNAELARVVLPILTEIPDVEIGSCEITDTRMYIKAHTPRVRGSVVGAEVCAGVLVSNSEVGAGSFRVEPFVYTLACTNGMVVSKELGGVALRRIHTGRRIGNDDESYRIFRDETMQADDRAFFMAAGDVVRAAVDEVRFRELVEVMTAAAEDRPVTDVAAAVETLAQYEGVSDGEARSILTHLASGGDLSRWGMLSAVTRTAEDVDSYDRATELEELGGKMLAYSPAQWSRIATATQSAS